VIPARYPLTETPERNDPTRTRRNIEDSDGTLILNLGVLDGGTALNVAHARQVGKPCLIVALEEGIEPAAFRDWLAANAIAVLNVAARARASGRGCTRRRRAVWKPCFGTAAFLGLLFQPVQRLILGVLAVHPSGPCFTSSAFTSTPPTYTRPTVRP